MGGAQAWKTKKWVCVFFIWLGSYRSTAYHLDCIGFWNVSKCCDTQQVMESWCQTSCWWKQQPVCCGKVLGALITPPPPQNTLPPHQNVSKVQNERENCTLIQTDQRWLILLNHSDTKTSHCFRCCQPLTHHLFWEVRDKWLKHFDCCHVYPRASFKDDDDGL